MNSGCSFIKSLLCTLCALLCGTFTDALPAKDTTLQQLKKRYGPQVRPWGGGYIIRANATYAFADKSARIVLPFIYREMTPVLPDRMVVRAEQNSSFALADGEGHLLAYVSGKPKLFDSRRRLFRYYYDNNAHIVNDSGRQLFPAYDTSRSDGRLIQVSVRTNGVWGQGFVNKWGDTILPAQYTSVSAGKELYAGMRGDTLSVWQLGKGLLFRTTAFHDCTILPNDFITVKKWGTSALISRTGRLLTPFRFFRLEALRLPYSMVPRVVSGGQPEPPLIPQYAIENGQPAGLIDASGKEVLPRIYDDIYMCSNGWKILRIVMGDEDMLVDAQGKTMLTYDYTRGMEFISARHVRIQNNDDDDNDNEDAKPGYRIYDMQQRRFVSGKGIVMPEEAVERARTAKYKANAVIEKAASMPANRPDSLYINRALSLLHKRGERWGVTSITGETILPFVYDTAGAFAYGIYYVGIGGRFAALSPEGTLLTPVGLKDLPWHLLGEGDSALRIRGGAGYSFAGGVLRPLTAAEEAVYAFPRRGTQQGGFMILNSASGGAKAGIYDDNRRRLTEYLPYRQMGGEEITNSGLILVSNKAADSIAVMDNTGKLRIPLMPKPSRFFLYEQAAFAVNDTGKPDVLYRFGGDSKTLIDTVQMWRVQKEYLLYGKHIISVQHGASLTQQYIGSQSQQPLVRFTNANGSDGFVSHRTGNVVFQRDLRDIQDAENNYTLLKTGEGWTLLDESGKRVLPGPYDSISTTNAPYYVLIKNGKQGLYDARTKHLHPAVYDRIGYPGSLNGRFLIVKKAGVFSVLDEKGRTISTGWDSVSNQSYLAVGALPAFRRGRPYLLYATAADTLEARPDDSLPEGAELLRDFMDETAIVRLNSMMGLYDRRTKRWIIPAKYALVAGLDGYYYAFTSYDSSGKTVMFSREGRELFRVNGMSEPQRMHPAKQWSMGGYYGPPVIDERGKVIVPDTFKSVMAWGKHRYQAETRRGKKGIIDTSGRMLLPAVMDEFGDASMYDGYHVAWKGKKMCLISPELKLLTPAIYEEIFPGYRREEEYYSGQRSIMSDYVDTADTRPFFIVQRGEQDSFGVLDGAGRVLLPCIYDSIRQVYHGRIVVVKKGGKWGLISGKAVPVAPFSYDAIETFHFGWARFRRQDVTGRISEDGVETVDVKR